MKFPVGKNTTISRLRVAYSGDRLAARLGFERLFGGMDLHPASLPPNAIVCIRKLRDPQPRTLQFDRAEWRYSDVWRNSVSREIENLYRRAYRPIRETVPAQAESIVFADYAELLASLAGDWCKGTLIQNWWWQSLFPNIERAQTIARIWIKSAEFAPTALQILFKKRVVAEFVNKLQPDESKDLLKQIIETFGLTKLQNALFAPMTKEEKTDFQQIIENKRKRVLKKQPAEMFFQTVFLSEIVSETHSKNLSFEKKVLLAVGILLDRAPRVARSAEFARQVRQFKIETEVLQKPLKQAAETISEQTIVFEKKIEKISEIIKPEIVKKSQPGFSKPETKTENLQKLTHATTFKKSENMGSETKEEQKVFPVLDADIPSLKESKIKAKVEKSSEVEEGKKPSRSLKIEQPEKSPTFSSVTSEETETEMFDVVIRSRYGGVFYLLNLGLYLGLYRDFSDSSGEEIDLNIWDFVVLLSRKFLGEDLEKDAVWSLLTDLAGRGDEKDFGRDFLATEEWRISPDWLKTFPTNKKWFWSKSDDRLIVRHSENFCVIDVSLDGFENQLENELKIYDELFSEIVEVTVEEFAPNLNAAQRWLKHFFEFAERRLLQALDLETRNDLTRVLFKKDATVAVSATQFEATFSLSELPLEVRFSGLDRNPGWIPAAGKYVEFHFV